MFRIGEREAADIIGLYLNPPQHAAVFCVGEKPAIQALDRLDPVLPMSPVVPNVMALSITDRELYACMRPWV